MPHAAQERVKHQKSQRMESLISIYPATGVTSQKLEKDLKAPWQQIIGNTLVESMVELKCGDCCVSMKCQNDTSLLP